ncbi:MAG: hypothetical protein ACI9HH_004642, partial [Pseudomonadota bacterium]
LTRFAAQIDLSPSGRGEPQPWSNQFNLNDANVGFGTPAGLNRL